MNIIWQGETKYPGSRYMCALPGRQAEFTLSAVSQPFAPVLAGHSFMVFQVLTALTDRFSQGSRLS
jgi:hypothetical protein